MSVTDDGSRPIGTTPHANIPPVLNPKRRILARIMHGPPVATADMVVLAGVLGLACPELVAGNLTGPNHCACPRDDRPHSGRRLLVHNAG